MKRLFICLGASLGVLLPSFAINSLDPMAQTTFINQRQPPTPEASETLVLQGVTFPVGAAAIPHAAIPVLETAVKLLKEHPQVRIRIEGHTDAPGNPATDQRLSEQRAVAVKEFLVRRGIDAARLETVGYGERQPVTETHTPADRALNSRVELKLIEEEPAP